MKRRFRLSQSSDFKRVRQQGRSYAHPLMVLIALPNQDAGKPASGFTAKKSRFGVSAGRSVGNAVQRNHAKRLLRESIRPHLTNVAPGWDVVLLARGPLAHATYEQCCDALISLLRRSRIWVEEEKKDG